MDGYIKQDEEINYAQDYQNIGNEKIGILARIIDTYKISRERKTLDSKING